MTKVGKSLSRWVQRIAGKTRAEMPAQPAQRPQELDARALTRVGGGMNASTQTPNKGW